MKFVHKATKSTLVENKNKNKKNENCITKRDQEVLVLLYHHRCLKTDQIADILFRFPSPHKENKSYLRIAQRRLKFLHENEYVERFFYQKEMGTSEYYYVLKKKGAFEVAEVLGCAFKELTWKKEINERTVAFLDHAAGINNIYVTFLNQERKNKFHEIDTFLVDYFLHFEFTFAQENVNLKPDAYIKYFTQEDGFHAFFEWDKGTMNKEQIKRKINRYRAFYQSNEYVNQGFETFPYICLIAPDKKRELNLLSMVQENNHSDLQWLISTEEKLKTNPLSAIWTNEKNENVHF